jgi:hypothetical protein
VVAFYHTAPLERLAAVRAQIASALKVIQNAEKALAAGEIRSAKLLHDSADESCTDIVRQITNLSDEDADALEPVFTRFEEHLIRVRIFVLPPTTLREDWDHATSCAALHRLM